MRRVAPLLLLSVLATACNDSALTNGGQDIEVAPGQILFDPTLGGASNTKTATVKNGGGSVLVVDQMEIAGLTPSDFQFDASQGGAFPISLGPGEWFAVQVTFSPGATGEHEGVLTIYSNDGDEPTVDVPLVTPGLAPDINATPNPLAFGVVTVNGTNTQPLTVSNVGTADLEITGAALAPGSNAAFSLMTSGILPTTLFAGQSLTLPVIYHPTSAASATGTVLIASNDPDEASYPVPIAGSASTNPVPDINASPSTVNFGQVPRLTCLTKTTSVQNTGAAALTVSNISRGFLTSLEYTWTPNNFTVAAGASQTLSITFCPADTGIEFGSLLAASNDPDENPYSITLYGEGVAPPLSQTDIAVEVTWDKNDTDVDTHFMRPGAAFNSQPGDTYYLNLSPDWGMGGDATDDPYLDYDDVDGYGPENLNFAKPATGTYRLSMYYYADNAHGGTTTTVKVWLNGTLAWQGTKLITNHQKWDVMDISWNLATDTGSYTLLGGVTQMFMLAPTPKN